MLKISFLLSLSFLSLTGCASLPSRSVASRVSNAQAFGWPSFAGVRYSAAFYTFANPYSPNQETQAFDFPPDFTIGELGNPAGELILFRVIGGKYVRYFQSSWSRAELDTQSYSASPFIAKRWSFKNPAEEYVIVALQNYRTDNLLGRWVEPSGFPRFLKMSADLPVQILGNAYSEVKVPRRRENALGTIRVDKFNEILDSFGAAPFSADALREKVVASGFFESARAAPEEDEAEGSRKKVAPIPIFKGPTYEIPVDPHDVWDFTRRTWKK